MIDETQYSRTDQPTRIEGGLEATTLTDSRIDLLHLSRFWRQTNAIRKLILVSPDGSKSVVLPGQSMTVGRTSESDVIVQNDKLLSRRHFEIRCRADGASVIDLDSTNGTSLNGQRIQASELSNADQIAAGLSRFFVIVRS